MDAFTKVAGTKVAGPLGFCEPNRPHRKKRRPYRRQMQDGMRVAVLPAFTAAKFLQRGEFRTVTDAAWACGTTRTYVAAAKVVLDAENVQVRDDVLEGRLPLLVAAEQLRRLATLVRAYSLVPRTDLPMFGKTVGVADLFDYAIAPRCKSMTTTNGIDGYRRRSCFR